MIFLLWSITERRLVDSIENQRASAPQNTCIHEGDSGAFLSIVEIGNPLKVECSV